MNPVVLALVCAFGGGALGVAFGAGIMWTLTLQSKKDVNGLGMRLERETKTAIRFRENMILGLMLMVPDEQRSEMARLLSDVEGDKG